MSRSKVFLILQAIVCALLVVLMSLSAIDIYRDGVARKAVDPRANTYTRQITSERFAPIAPLFFLGIGLMVAGLVLGIRDEGADKPVKDAELTRDLTAARVSSPSDAMRREQRAQRRLKIIGWGAFALCMVPIALYLSRAEHFPLEDLEGMFAGLIRVFLPWTAVGLGALAVTSVLTEKSVLRETEAAQAQMKAERAQGIKLEAKAAQPKRSPVALQVACALVAVALIVMGVFNQSAKDVLIKAITICTECVGLG